MRMAAIRLTKRELAVRSGCDANTVGRVLRGESDPRVSTIDALSTVILEEELRLLAHLRALHPEADVSEMKSEAA